MSEKFEEQILHKRDSKFHKKEPEKTAERLRKRGKKEDPKKLTTEKPEMTDIERAMKWAKHIDNPCSVEVNEKTENIREFYLREAKKELPFFKNPHAKEFLRSKIKEYEEDNAG